MAENWTGKEANADPRNDRSLEKVVGENGQLGDSETLRKNVKFG